MKVLVFINHPADVHQFKNMIWILEEHGHTVKILARHKEVSFYLLDIYGFKYMPIGKLHASIIGKAYELITTDYKCYKLAKEFGPDILVDVAIYGSHISRLIRKPSIIFNDTEIANLTNMLYVPFANVICNPSCFKKNLGGKQVRYNGYHELAYLHPNYFKPDSSVLDELGLSEKDNFVILRFVAWQAAHDIGQHGFDMPTKRKLVEEISKYARVFITSEIPLPSEFDKYKVTAPPEKIHDLLYYATILIGDTQTMTTEAAVLGTPAIRCNSFVGPNDMGNFIELEKKYDLIYSFREPDKAIQKAVELLQQPDLKKQWAKKRERLLVDKIDVTQFMVDFIENYPQSFYRYKQESRNRQ